MDRRVVTVFGGSGFIGRHLVQRLAGAGWIVRAGVRDPEAANFLKMFGDPGQVVPLYADVSEPRTLPSSVPCQTPSNCFSVARIGALASVA